MSKPHETRGRRVATTRANLQNPTPFIGPQDPLLPLSPIERLLGGEMRGGLPLLDLAFVLTDIITPERSQAYPARIRAAARKALDDRTAKGVAALERTIVRELDRNDLEQDVAIQLDRIVAVLPFHQAALGSAEANARLAAAALREAMTPSGSAAIRWLALRSAMLFAEDADEEMDALRHVPEPRYPRLDLLNATLGYLSSDLSIAVEAQELVSVDRAILDGGVGVPEGSHDNPEDVETLEALLRAGGVPPGAPHRGPSLIALAKAGLDHLPGSPTTGTSNSSRGSTPRGEFNPMAGLALPLVHGVDVAAVREVLDREFPWMAGITGSLLGALVGGRYARLHRTLLVGSPGSGKTRYLRRLCAMCRIPSMVYSAAGVADASFGGTSRQWGTGRACVPLQLIQRTRTANPVVIVDEVEKAGSTRHNGSLVDTLTALTEPEGSRAFFDPYLETEVDLSAVQYLATANSTSGVAAPLLDRFRIVAVPDPRPCDLPAILATLVPEIREDRGLDEAWCPDLDPEETALVAAAWGKGGSIRPLRRIVETLLSGRESLAPRH